MFAQLPNVFDRGFAIGYFLPAGLFLAASLGIGQAFGASPPLVSTFKTDPLIGTTIFGLIALLVAVTLLALNRSITQWLEGYGAYNPFQLVGWRQRQQHKELRTRLDALKVEEQQCRAQGKAFPDTSLAARDEAMGQLAERFPEDAEWVLPTAFGNTIRAFETYAFTMYGFDAIVGWNRLLSVIPTDYRDLIDAAKAEVDFWMNLWALAFVVIGEWLALAVRSGVLFTGGWIWIPLLAIVGMVITSRRARSAAVEWGDLVKASVDVYLPALGVQLGLPADPDPKKVRAAWEEFSAAVNYRRPTSLPHRASG